MASCPSCLQRGPQHAPGCPEDSLPGAALGSTAVLDGTAPVPLLSPPPPAPPAPAAAATPRPGDLPPGTQVGEYRVTGVLGRGGMGVVYSGVHPVIGKRVAIKVLKTALIVDQASLERFQREAQAVNRINHPAVVDVFAFGLLPSSAPYLVMDLLEGQSLSAWLKRGAPALSEVREIFAQILAGLHAAHEVGVVHRDLKPDNIMLLGPPGTRVKILDFGIAKLAHEDVPTLTRTGMALGTPAYMSPEQALGRGVGPASDLYSTAVMLYLCCAGRLPFVSDSSFEVQHKHVTMDPEPPSRYAEMPPELEALILRGLHKSPQGRFESATAMAQALLLVPAGELRRRERTEDAASSHSPQPSFSGTGTATLAEATRLHRRRLVVAMCPPETSQCPESARWIGDALEDGLLTRLCEMAEVDIVRPPAGVTGHLRGADAARAAHADLYLEVTLQVAGSGEAAALRANLRIGTPDPQEAPFSARATGRVSEVFALEDEIHAAARAELRQRARSHAMRVQLVDDKVAGPAQQALRQAEAAFSSPWDNARVIERALSAADHALQIDPNYAEAYYRRGTARMWLAATCGGPAGDGQIDAAIADLRAARDRAPNFAAVAIFLGTALAIRGRVTEALGEIERAATLEASRPGLRSGEAMVGDLALAWPRVVATVLPGDALFADQGLPLLILGRVLGAVGRLDQAEAVLQRLLPIEEADIQATRTGQRRTMRTLPLYGPSLALSSVLLLRGRGVEAYEVLQASRERLASCEHVTAEIYQFICLRLLLEAMRRAGRTERQQEVETAEAVLSRRLLGTEPELQAIRAGRLLGIFWAPLCYELPPAPGAAPAWRHHLTALFAMRNGDPRLAREAIDTMRAAAADAATRADADLLRAQVDAIAAL